MNTLTVLACRLSFLTFHVFAGLPAISFAQAGSIDPSFGTNGLVLQHLDTFPDQCNALAILDDQKILISGTSFDNLGTPYNFLARYTENGAPDVSFGMNGMLTTVISASGDHGMLVQDDGKILIGSAIGLNQCALARFNDDGTPDLSFGSNGIVTTDVPGYYGENCQSISIQDDGKIIAGGYMNENGGDLEHFLLIRYDEYGVLDPTFGTSGIATGGFGFGYSTVIQSNGQIIIGGRSASMFGMERFNSDGSLDASFGNNGTVLTQVGLSNSIGKSIALNENGKILFGGQSNAVSSGLPTSNFSVAQYHSNGDLDSSFGTDGIVITDVIDPSFSYSTRLAMELQDDYKIVLAANAGNHFALARYNTDGTLDANFGAGGLVYTAVGDYSAAKAIGLQSNGKIVVGGYYNTNSDTDIALIRYNGDGANSLPEFDSSLQQMMIYPNPSNGSTTIAFANKVQDATLILYSSGGEKVKQFLNVSGTTLNLPLKNAPDGVYFVHLLEEGKIRTIDKIVVKN